MFSRSLVHLRTSPVQRSDHGISFTFWWACEPEPRIHTSSGTRISGTFFGSLSDKLNPKTGLIDYDQVDERAMGFHPKILICGASSYSTEWNYAMFREIADKCGAILMHVIADISGLMAAKCSSYKMLLGSRHPCLLPPAAIANRPPQPPSPSPSCQPSIAATSATSRPPCCPNYQPTAADHLLNTRHLQCTCCEYSSNE